MGANTSGGNQLLNPGRVAAGALRIRVLAGEHYVFKFGSAGPASIFKNRHTWRSLKKVDKLVADYKKSGRDCQSVACDFVGCPWPVVCCGKRKGLPVMAAVFSGQDMNGRLVNSGLLTLAFLSRRQMWLHRSTLGTPLATRHRRFLRRYALAEGLVSQRTTDNRQRTDTKIIGEAQ